MTHILCKNIKYYHDNIHGYINLTVFAKHIIDTKYFQRLDKLHQLGVAHYIYRDAVHTRFAHSVGTYHNAGELLNTIVNTTNPPSIDEYLANIPELKNYYARTYENKIHPLDEYVCELVKIAGLTHDIGHGCFSHAFDDHFIPDIGKADHPYATHEARSAKIIELVIRSNEMLNCVSDDEIKFIQTLINPSKHHIGFLYQIISNTLNGLDVDKFDYLTRDVQMIGYQAKIDCNRVIRHIKVINNNIIYPEQATDDIINIFYTRYRLHSNVYCHKTVIAVEFMIVELMKLIEPILHISDKIDDMESFCDLTDDYIIESVKFIDLIRDKLSQEQLHNLEQAKILLDKIMTRKLYTTIYINTFKDKVELDLLDKDNFLIFQRKIGFVSGNKPNPLDSIYVYKTKKPDEIFGKLNVSKKSIIDLSTLMPNGYQEYLLMIYYKEKVDFEMIKEMSEYIKSYC